MQHAPNFHHLYSDQNSWMQGIGHRTQPWFDLRSLQESAYYPIYHIVLQHPWGSLSSFWLRNFESHGTPEEKAGIREKWWKGTQTYPLNEWFPEQEGLDVVSMHWSIRILMDKAITLIFTDEHGSTNHIYAQVCLHIIVDEGCLWTHLNIRDADTAILSKATGGPSGSSGLPSVTGAWPIVRLY